MHLTPPWLLPMLLRTPPYMARARRLPPLVLQTAQRTTICDLDVDVQEVPPDALDRHRAPRALLPRVRMLVPLVARARLAVGDGDRAPRLARPGDEAAAVRREAELVVVGALEVAAPSRVLRLERDIAAGHGAARDRGGLHADGLEGLGKGAVRGLGSGRGTLGGAMGSVLGAVRGRAAVVLVVRIVSLALHRLGGPEVREKQRQ